MATYRDGTAVSGRAAGTIAGCTTTPAGSSVLTGLQTAGLVVGTLVLRTEPSLVARQLDVSRELETRSTPQPGTLMALMGSRNGRQESQRRGENVHGGTIRR